MQAHNQMIFPQAAICLAAAASVADGRVAAKANPPPLQPSFLALFSSTFCAYIHGCRRKPAIAINGRRNKPIGPGGSTRRLHQGTVIRSAVFWMNRLLITVPCGGRNRIDEGVK